MPVKDIPELLVENRRICMELAKQFMQLMTVLSQFFGIPLMEVIFDSIPEEAEQENLDADGIREAAAAKTYWDLKGGGQPDRHLQRDARKQSACPQTRIR